AGDDPVRDAFRRAKTEREAVLVSPSGGEVPVHLRSARLGRPSWLVVTLRDQTRVRRMEQELRRHERLAMLGQLSAGAAHEIRNAIQAVRDAGTRRYEVRRVRRGPSSRGPGRGGSDRSRRRGRPRDAGWITYQQVRVIDTGVGIPRHALAKLFDPFFSTKPQG